LSLKHFEKLPKDQRKHKGGERVEREVLIMDYTSLFLIAYIASLGFFVMLLIVFSIIEKGKDEYKMRPYKRLP
jgi:hypothetical protein